MFEIKNINNSEPYLKFESYFSEALKAGQSNPEVICISSLNTEKCEVESRFVNLKYIINNEWIFFSNYNSEKARNFDKHNQITALLYWNKINVQIRIKAKIRKSSDSFSDYHFDKRTKEKNALSISSYQSTKIDSYEKVTTNYKEVLNNEVLLSKRPEYWGGYSFVPYYFEFWEGHEARLNKRIVFSYDNESWNSFILQP